MDSGPDTLRYPDIVLDRVGGAGKDHTATQLAFLAEVLSPSSTATDLGDKVAEYLKIPTLIAYLVLSQDEPKAWLWVGATAHSPLAPRFSPATKPFSRSTRWDFELVLSEIYAGITFA